jgi:hypothetical protein
MCQNAMRFRFCARTTCKRYDMFCFYVRTCFEVCEKSQWSRDHLGHGVVMNNNIVQDASDGRFVLCLNFAVIRSNPNGRAADGEMRIQFTGLQ